MERKEPREYLGRTRKKDAVLTTPGEEKIYNFILEVSAQCARRSLMADCTNDRLVARGKIQRKRGFGGIKYAPCLKDLTALLKESPGNFKPTTFSPHTMAFEEDDSLLDIFEHAQHGLESFQEYYERMLVDRLREVK